MASLRSSAKGWRGSGDKQDKAPEAMRVWLLGGFRVSVGSRTVGSDGWRLRKAASLVKLLALSPGHRLHRERVMDLLWPDLAPKAAANNLRHALHVARRALEPVPTSSYLRLVDEELVLCPAGSLRVDVEAFEEAALTARRGREPAVYRAAIELYTGELLPEDRYEDWIEARREVLRATYADLLLKLAGLHDEREERERAVEVLRRAVAADPTLEEAHAGLMRLYALGGRKGEALKQYEKLEEALRRELGVGPGEESRRLREEVLSGRITTDGRSSSRRSSEERTGAGSHNLPLPRGSFVGRGREVVEVRRALAMTNLLTLTGTGGSGKTRLSLEVARELVGSYPDGVWLVELAPLSDGSLVPQALASALGVREQPGRPLVETLAEHLRDKRLLLLLDNCEHLVDDAAHVADELLATCPRLEILATSREPLGVAGEVDWRVPPLSVPDDSYILPVEDLARYEAVRLFVERARQRLPAFSLTPENAGAVVEICRRLDGIPLAIELATARITALAVEQVAERLGNSLNLLAAGLRTAAPRHRTMRATLEWSHDLLTEEEKEMFRRLSVFAGGWSLAAAEAVGERDGAVLGLLNSLVDKSLVVAEAVDKPHAASLRYRMLEPIRQYARESLEESGEADRVRRRHAAFYLALAEEAEPEFRGAEQVVWLERLEREHDNMRAALSWELDGGGGESGLRLAGALGDFWHARGHLSEGRRWLEQALAKGDSSPPAARVRALAHAGYLAWEQIDYEKATALSKEGLALSREVEDRAGIAAALYVLGAVAMFQTRFEETSTLLEEALALWRELGDDSNVARTLQGLGLVAVARHDYRRAMAIHKESLALAHEAGDRLGVILALGQGALAAIGLGEHDLAEDLCAEGLDLARQLGHPHAIMFTLNVWSVLATAQGQPVRSARMWGAAAGLGRTIGITDLSPVEQHHYGPYIAAARAELGEAAWKAAWTEGGTMTQEEAIEYALGPARPAPLEVLERSAPEGDAVSAKAIDKAGKLAWEQGDYASARTLHERSLRLHRRTGNKPGIALSLNNLGLVALYQGDHATAVSLCEKSLSLRRELRDERGTAASLHNLGLAALYRGDNTQAEAYFEESLSLSRELGDKWVVSTALNNLGLMALHQGDYGRASELQKESLNLRVELGDRVGVAECLEGMSGISAARNEPSRAARLWSAAEAARETIGAPPPPCHSSLYETHLAPVRTDEAAWKTARSEGRAMTLDEAIAYATSEEKLVAAPVAKEAPVGTPPPSLTRREWEVATLIARGITSNRRISPELSISERTVETHVRNILKKLGLKSRAQIAVWATERD